MWVARNRNFANDQWKLILEKTRDFGLLHVQEIAAHSAEKYQLSVEQCQDYLTNFIRFFLRDDERAGLNEFRRRCEVLGLISN